MFSKQYYLFNNAAFRHFTLSCALAMFGNGLTYIIMIWVLMRFDTSVVSTAILMACFWLPNVLFGPFLGVVSDRCNRKFLMLFTNSLRAICLLGFALIAYHNQISPLAIYVLATILGTVLAAYIPTAMTFVREIVTDNDDLLYANAMVDTAYEIGAVAGMGGAGLILASTSFATCFVINALCYVAATALIWLIPYQSAKADQQNKESFMQQFVQGGRYIIKRIPILLIYLVQGLFFICYMTAPVLLAPFAKVVLHSSVAQFGWLEAMLSLGIVAGGFLSPWLADRFSLTRVIFGQVLTGIIAFYLFSHTENVMWAIFYHFFIGFSFSSWALLTTLAQEMTDLDYQGRVQSLFNSMSGAIIILFYYILAQWKDTPVTKLYIGEICLLLLAAVLLILMTINNRQNEDELEAELDSD
ncbi:enterobactin exporter EntS [Legionella massiliensis]|uniref:Enterobactin exporter EntS n=1 Tax=Legionella massiliensis TaxID=1034943 RepID=A0A078KYG9_9GAMM|nr:MFS transporter [Legionella massiliensis]CDZ78122.1 enterobactin exporter EntS [Legionella massiliensis]CEE13860.1 enterobactin exporter EntS [Legionella massiliensis]